MIAGTIFSGALRKCHFLSVHPWHFPPRHTEPGYLCIGNSDPFMGRHFHDESQLWLVLDKPREHREKFDGEINFSGSQILNQRINLMIRIIFDVRQNTSLQQSFCHVIRRVASLNAGHQTLKIGNPDTFGAF